ncbi:integrase core domain-containing protein, partial [Kitasatospora aureofaciens]
GVTRSHSRPKVSNDNPYSEAHFKTTKYMSDYPERFDSLAHAREWFDAFISYYNHEHRHSGIGLHTPASV